MSLLILFFKIYFQLFVKEDSAAELGTSYSSMNRNGKTNAKKGPERDYNAYKEFFDRESEAHVLAKWMNFAGINNIEGLTIFISYLFHIRKLAVTCIVGNKLNKFFNINLWIMVTEHTSSVS